MRFSSDISRNMVSFPGFPGSTVCALGCRSLSQHRMTLPLIGPTLATRPSSWVTGLPWIRRREAHVGRVTVGLPMPLSVSELR